MSGNYHRSLIALQVLLYDVMNVVYVKIKCFLSLSLFLVSGARISQFSCSNSDSTPNVGSGEVLGD